MADLTHERQRVLALFEGDYGSDVGSANEGPTGRLGAGGKE